MKATKIKTTTDLRLSIQKVKSYLTDTKGKRKTDDEICLMVYGYDPQKDRDVEEAVTLTKEDAFNLIAALTDLLIE